MLRAALAALVISTSAAAFSHHGSGLFNQLPVIIHTDIPDARAVSAIDGWSYSLCFRSFGAGGAGVICRAVLTDVVFSHLNRTFGRSSWPTDSISAVTHSLRQRSAECISHMPADEISLTAAELGNSYGSRRSSAAGLEPFYRCLQGEIAPPRFLQQRGQ